MNAVLVSVLVASVVCLVSAQGPGGRGPPPGGRGGPGGRGPPPGGRGGHGHHKGPPPGMMMKFESCKPFHENMRNKFDELMQAKEIGPSVCLGDRKDCMKEDGIKVRCATENPSDECIQEVNDYMSGNMCSGELETAQYE